MSAHEVTACLVVIGNEILSGRTQDANLAFLAKELNEAGIRMREARVIPDDDAVIVRTVNELRATYDYVFTSGGIGPTHDDITAAAIARAFGLELTRHPEAERRLRAYIPAERLNEARLKMAETPEGATLIDNPVSVAPGFRVENVFVLAGIPSILQAMVKGVVPGLEGGAPMLSRTVVAFCPEGEIAAALSAIQARHGSVEIGSYPGMRQNRFATSLVFRSTDQAAIEAACHDLLGITAERGITTEPLT